MIALVAVLSCHRVLSDMFATAPLQFYPTAMWHWGGHCPGNSIPCWQSPRTHNKPFRHTSLCDKARQGYLWQMCRDEDLRLGPRLVAFHPCRWRKDIPPAERLFDTQAHSAAITSDRPKNVALSPVCPFGIACSYVLAWMCPPGSVSTIVPAPSTIAICRCGRVSLFQVTGPCFTPSGTYSAEVVSNTSR